MALNVGKFKLLTIVSYIMRLLSIGFIDITWILMGVVYRRECGAELSTINS